MSGSETRGPAIEELKRLIREQKARIDPRLLEVAAELLAAQNKPIVEKPPAEKAAAQPPAPKHPVIQDTKRVQDNQSVPYDKAAAADAVERFLKDHKDQNGFKKRLLEYLTKKSQ